MTVHEEFQQSHPIEIEVEGGLRLRQLFIEDAEAYFDLIKYDRAHLTQFNDPTAEKYKSVADVINSIVNPDNPDRLRLGIRNGDQMVGSINLTPKENNQAEIGYWVGKQYIGHGYAAKAVRSLSKYGFDEHNYDSLFARVVVGNEASKRTLLNSGYNFVKLFKEIVDSKEVWLWKFEQQNTQK